MTTLDHNTTPLGEALIPSVDLRDALDKLLVECRPDCPPTPWIDQVIDDHYGELRGEDLDRVREKCRQYMAWAVEHQEMRT
jgi:hypothetical protein